MEKEAAPGVKTEPRLGNLASSATAPSITPKRGRIPAEKKEAPPKPKPVTKAAAKYAMESLNKKMQTETGDVARIMSQVYAYRRHFPKLDYSSMPDTASFEAWSAFLEDLVNQNAEEGSVQTLKHVYCILLEVGVRGNMFLGNPIGMNIRTLPAVAKTAIHEKNFLEKEFQELAILHPEWCRPGPFARICIATLGLIREVHNAETTGAVYTAPEDNVTEEAKQKYRDL
ncbi:MAG: hypothetical protein JSR46_02640 [Verrucomicrobia bacterium]|nr:hypothetical protein [Verrucomicrobiota bacterium]